MSAAVGYPPKPGPLWCISLFLLSVLAGCATASGGRAAVVRQGVLLAMSDVTAAGGAPLSQMAQGYNVPGRKPESQMPWEFFMGNASHRLIAFKYQVNHPDSVAYYNNKSLKTIIRETGLGDSSLLRPDEREICPDITDVSRLVLFEIKPWNERARQEGREEARRYLAALNRTLLVGRGFVGGTDFQGEILIRFARGQYIWRLEWKTAEPGVVQYRWTRSQKPFDSEAAAYQAAQWEDLTVEELRQYGGWVEKAVEGMLNRREKLTTVSGTVGMVIDLIGGVATTVLWGAILGQMGSGPGAQQPPAQGGGQVIPFPARPVAPAPAPQMPAAAGMSLSP